MKWGKPLELEIGSEYVLGRIIAEGSHSIVYECLRRIDGEFRLVAKVAKHDSEGENEQRLRAEAQILSCLDNPNILRSIAIIDENGIFGIVFPRYTKSIWEIGPSALTFEQKMRVARQLLSAIADIHLYGIVHSDLNPQNIFLDLYGNVVVGDFSASWYLKEGLPKELFGSPTYNAPERWIEGEEINEKIDQYSLGVLFYWLFEGRFPFNGHGRDLIVQHVFDQPPALEVCPLEIASVVFSMLAKKHQDRPECMQLCSNLEAAYKDHLEATTHHVAAVRLHFDVKVEMEGNLSMQFLLPRKIIFLIIMICIVLGISLLIVLFALFKP